MYHSHRRTGYDETILSFLLREGEREKEREIERERKRKSECMCVPVQILNYIFAIFEKCKVFNQIYFVFLFSFLFFYLFLFSKKKEAS